MSAWLLTFWLGLIVGGMISIPEIASEQDCQQLGERLNRAWPISAAESTMPVRWQCIPYKMAK
jgi:hypothetical protein